MSSHSEQKHSLPALVLAALGVVYGDIGTSPLYALRECFSEAHGLQATPGNVLGVLSLVFWSLIVIITLMYITFVLRADNRGEGGILALMILGLSGYSQNKVMRRLLVITVGLFGAALLIGDGMITPSISVLSAVEGLGVVTDRFDNFILPITVLILLFVFWLQRRGTGSVGLLFGPIILVWFITLALLGINSIIHWPDVLSAVSPHHGIRFLIDNGYHGFFILGSVFLVVTGGEALYADMGHFGAKPIRYGWFGLVLPALLLNYFGQGALLLHEPDVIHPFYALAPAWGMVPLVVLSTAATVIASQAVISGVFSLTRQAVLLGYLPRVNIVHTSSAAIGQIFVPVANGFLMLGTIGLVLGFQTSSNLAAAYGVAVTSTMLFTTLLLFVVMRHVWHWSLKLALPLCLLFLAFNASFAAAAALKIPQGGWFPLLVGVAMYIVMTTWRAGRKLVAQRLGTMVQLPLDLFIDNITQGDNKPARVPGAAVYLFSSSNGTPRAMLHNLRYNKVLHEQVVVLTFKIEERPHVPLKDRISVEDMGQGFYRIFGCYGFMESPDVSEILDLAEEQGLKIERHTAVFVLARENIKSTERGGMMRWREKLFIFLSRNAQEASSFFNIPLNQVIELGIQVEI